MARRLSRIACSLCCLSCCCHESSSDEDQGQGQELTTIQPGSEVPPGSEGQSTVAPPKYGKFQEAGVQYQRWIEDPNEPNCKISRSTLTFDRFEASCSAHEFEGIGGVDALGENAMSLGVVLDRHRLSGRQSFDVFETDFDIGGTYRHFSIRNWNTLTWIGYTGPGVIFLDNIAREKNANPLQIPEVSQALYERDFSIDTLNHVFITQVINDETLDLLEGLYDDLVNIVDTSFPMMIWPYGMPPFDALLGTPLGKVVAALVLGAFPRGTRRIVRIVTAWAPYRGGNLPDLRFDIETVR